MSDATLAGLIKELRRSLQDTDRAEPIIRTSHRVGYAFCATSTTILLRGSSAMWRWLVIRGRRIALPRR